MKKRYRERFRQDRERPSETDTVRGTCDTAWKTCDNAWGERKRANERLNGTCATVHGERGKVWHCMENARQCMWREWDNGWKMWNDAWSEREIVREWMKNVRHRAEWERRRVKKKGAKNVCFWRDVVDECKKFGGVLSVRIDPQSGLIFLLFSDFIGRQRAEQGLSGRW